MITIKSPREVEKMRVAGGMVAQAHAAVARCIRPGITTLAIEEAADRAITDLGGEMAFHGYRGFPGKVCVSVNEEVVHGIPGDRRLVEGDIVGVDIGARYKNYHGDSAWTYAVGKVSPDAEKLLAVGQEALERGIETVRPGERISQIGRTIQGFVEGHGFRVVEKYVGHGIGRQLHEAPQVPNYAPRNGTSPDYTIKPGMTLAIEPMVNAGSEDVKTLGDGWTVVTIDGRLSAHFEHTVLVTPDGYEVLTRP